MSCGCGGCGGCGGAGAGAGGPLYHPASAYHALEGDAALLGAPPLVTSDPGPGQPERAPAPAAPQDAIPWYTWLLIAITVFSFLRGKSS